MGKDKLYDRCMAAHSIEEALVAKLRELPADKQQEVLDFASFLETTIPSLAKFKSTRNIR